VGKKRAFYFFILCSFFLVVQSDIKNAR